MQQFKTYPGIPPSGVVERPSVLRIPPRPAGVLLHLTGNFGRIKWYYGREKPCISGIYLSDDHYPRIPRSHGSLGPVDFDDV